MDIWLICSEGNKNKKKYGKSTDKKIVLSLFSPYTYVVDHMKITCVRGAQTIPAR